MVAEIGFDDIGNLIDLHGEERILECAADRAARDPAEIAALPACAGVVGKFRGQRREILAGPRAFQRRVGPVQSFFGTPLADRHENMPGAPLVVCREELLLLLVVAPERLFARVDLRGDRRATEFNVFEVDGLLAHVQGAVGRMVRGDGRLVDLDLIEKIVDREKRIGQLAPFVDKTDVAAKLGRGQEGRVDDAVLQLLQPELPALQGFEAGWRQALAAQHGPVHLDREHSADLKRGQAANALADTLIGYAVARICRTLREGFGAHELIEDVTPEFEPEIVTELDAKQLLVFALLALQFLLELEQRYVGTVDLRRECRAGSARSRCRKTRT